MQPMLVLSAASPGIMYINGRFAGEMDGDAPLMRPVSSRGAIYLDYRPLTPSCDSLTRKLVLSGGLPLAESAERAANLDIVIWPGGIIEIEINPPLRAGIPRHFMLADHDFCLNGSQLICDGHPLSTLPDGAGMPEIHPISTGILLVGACHGGRYLLAMDSACTRQIGFLQAQQIDIADDGHIRVIIAPGDLAGHAAREQWSLTADGLMLVSSEPAWEHGSPRWPSTPAETARAAIEAILAGLYDEAEGYLSPGLRTAFDFARLRESCDLCVEMKYAPPDGRPCIGLLRLEGERMARVTPLYYRASPSGGLQGPWQIEAFEWPE